MQNEPEKILGNFNELRSQRPSAGILRSAVELQVEGELTIEQQEIIEVGTRLVNHKIDEILGAKNRLTSGNLELPETTFVEAEPDHPTWAGYFSAAKNKIVIITSKAKDRLSQTKVYIHEYLHFLSHNARDDGETVGDMTPLAVNNNIGFRRYFGCDIRKGKEGEITSDYFLAFNEATTEQLAIDIFPGVFETYNDYRGLLNQVIDDIVMQGLGTESGGVFQPWSRGRVKNYIYQCFFKGDLGGFTQLLQATYSKYDISEQQFGLMTHRNDLPSVIERSLIVKRPGSPPPTPGQVKAMVQIRLDNKTPEDYVTDIEDTDIGGDEIKYELEYDSFVSENNIEYSHPALVDGVECDIDNQGYIIYRGEKAAAVFGAIKEELDALLANTGLDAETVSDRMDQLLFETYSMSMLSDGFRAFYVYKHSKIDNL